MSVSVTTSSEKNSLDFPTDLPFDSAISSDPDISHPGIIMWGVSNEDGEIQKSIGKFRFPWKELTGHGYSPDYVRCLLSEMTPFAVAETEEHVVVVYSPAKLIGGSEIANLIDGKRSFSDNEGSINETIATIDDFQSSDSSEDLPPSFSKLTSTPSPAGIFSRIKQWFSFSF